MRGRAWVKTVSFCTHLGAQPQKANATLANPTNTNKKMTMTRTTKLNRLALVLVAALFVASLLLSTASADGHENSTASADTCMTSDHFHTEDGSTCYCWGSKNYDTCGECKDGATFSTHYKCMCGGAVVQCGAMVRAASSFPTAG